MSHPPYRNPRQLIHPDFDQILRTSLRIPPEIQREIKEESDEDRDWRETEQSR